MAIVRNVILFVLGAVVLVGCQKPGNETDGSTERPRQAGEIESVSTQSGDIMQLSCMKSVVQKLGAKATSADMNSCITKKAVKGMSATTARGRHFYNEATITTYLYLPYYYNYGNNNYGGINQNYNDVNSYSGSGSGTDSSLTTNQLCKLLFGKSCWSNDWYSTYFGYNATNYGSNNYGQSYNSNCSSWLNQANYTTYVYSPYTTSGSNPYYYNQNQNQNQSWYGCYNVY
jgi:hypothetical protein